MSISLASIASKVSTAIAIAQAAEPAVAKVYAAVASMVVDAESAYASAESAGKSKLASVLVGAEAVAADVGKDWASLVDDVTSLVTVIKSTYNNAVAASTASASAAVSTAAASAASAVSTSTAAVDATAGAASIAETAEAVTA